MNALTARLLSLVNRVRDQRRGRIARLVEVQSFGATTKLAVVQFAGRTLLLSVSREGIALIASDLPS
ncbi:flagellar biosynthetic protein FliO [Sphingomonas sp.]|uniref:flagellar biosynthetic protein FliO n=1 Tax=Sphingomonas sp. TaxID=28214 RepID=UPI0025DBF085|nr:flagellar biosynthetic protein FliO [Sphingomonas sp.]